MTSAQNPVFRPFQRLTAYSILNHHSAFTEDTGLTQQAPGGTRKKAHLHWTKHNYTTQKNNSTQLGQLTHQMLRRRMKRSKAETWPYSFWSIHHMLSNLNECFFALLHIIFTGTSGSSRHHPLWLEKTNMILWGINTFGHCLRQMWQSWNMGPNSRTPEPIHAITPNLFMTNVGMVSQSHVAFG